MKTGCRIHAGSPLTFGRGFSDLVFARSNGPQKDFKYMQEAQWFFKPLWEMFRASAELM